MKFPFRRINLPLPIEKPPQGIYVQGSPDAFPLLLRLPYRGLAVVGTRAPQSRAEGLVRNAIGDLKGSGLIIVSGLALGVDACAHEAALDSGLPTIAILGSGLNAFYPRENLDLRDRILHSGGLILSEYEPQEAPKPHYFLERNRLISALARAVWIAQAPFKSGALSTARYALKQGKDIYVTPCFPGDPTFAGSQAILECSEANPFWNAESLDQTWSELSTWFLQKKRGQLTPGATDDPLLKEIRHRTAQNGGTSSNDLLDWALDQGFSPLDFFERLQKAQQCGSVSERDGIIATM